MNQWLLQRVHRTPKETFGVLIKNRPICLTLEDPWRLNQVNVSCIPPGIWQARPYASPTHGPTWEIEVPGRTAILIHAGNTELDTTGCILLGQKWGDGMPLDILDSRAAISRFQSLQKMEAFELVVVDPILG